MPNAYGKFYNGAQPGRRTAVTPASLSAQAGKRVRSIPLGNFTQNTTVKHNCGSLGIAGKVVAAYLSAKTKPAGGTLSTRLVAYDASANAEINLSETFDPETLTDREGAALTLASTNVALDADDTLEVHNIASNDAVTQQQVDGYLVVVWVPTEDTSSAGKYTLTAELQ